MSEECKNTSSVKSSLIIDSSIEIDHLTVDEVERVIEAINESYWIRVVNGRIVVGRKRMSLVKHGSYLESCGQESFNFGKEDHF